MYDCDQANLDFIYHPFKYSTPYAAYYADTRLEVVTWKFEPKLSKSCLHIELKPLKTMELKNVTIEEVDNQVTASFNLTEENIQDECFGKTCMYLLYYNDWRITFLQLNFTMELWLTVFKNVVEIEVN